MLALVRIPKRAKFQRLYILTLITNTLVFGNLSERYNLILVGTGCVSPETSSTCLTILSKGPAFLPSGIYKAAHLLILPGSLSSAISETKPEIFVEESSIDIYKSGQNFSTDPVETADWVVNVSLAIRSAMIINAPVLSLSIPELRINTTFTKIEPIFDDHTTSQWLSVLWTIPNDKPERWFPHNIGKPRLYNLSVKITAATTIRNDGLQFPLSTMTEVATFNTTIGFRTIRLIQSPYSDKEIRERGITPGDQWHFRINGKPFYTKVSDDASQFTVCVDQ